MKMIVAPSLLAADFLNLGREVEMVNTSDASWLHLDVMDGRFVPNISFGFPVIEAVSRVARKPLDVHLMVEQPELWIDKVAALGAEYMNVHFETARHLHRTVQAIRDAGMRPAVTLCPATPVEVLRDIINDVDMVLLMSVNPGFGGQRFIPATIGRIERLRHLIDEATAPVLIEVDGGINHETACAVLAAGADAVVAGTGVFRASDPRAEIAYYNSL
ncbi:MAG: ribulose-phosphate 3-epimerase [Muribaculaceae bacterium]|nr:ribulose-phosphate 3-epimerase [Muribaculaceae bacterium]